MIKIVKESFDLENEFKNISSNKNGAYSFFLGTVRSDLSFSNTEIKGIYLECYEELAISQLEKIRLQALKKWDLSECLIIHRIGRLNLGEKIVLDCKCQSVYFLDTTSYSKCHENDNIIEIDLTSKKIEFSTLRSIISSTVFSKISNKIFPSPQTSCTEILIDSA